MQINIAKANRPMSVNVDGFTPPVLEYVIRYGLTQMLNDAHSQVTAKTEADAVTRGESAWALAQKKLDALVSGVTRAARASGPRGDAVATEVRRIARANIMGNAIKRWPNAQERESVLKVNFIKWLDEYTAKNAVALREAAEKAIAEREALAIDMDDLMALPVGESAEA